MSNVKFLLVCVGFCALSIFLWLFFSQPEQRSIPIIEHYTAAEKEKLAENGIFMSSPLVPSIRKLIEKISVLEGEIKILKESMNCSGGGE